jgi:hypothetical protein
MDMRTGRIIEFKDLDELETEIDRRNIIEISRVERRKLERYEPSLRPAVLVEMRKSPVDRSRAKAARKARRKQRGK